MLLAAYDQHLAAAHKGPTPGTDGDGSIALRTESIGRAPSDALTGQAPGDALIGRAPSDALTGQAPGDGLISPAPSDGLRGRAPGDGVIGPAPGDGLRS
jgi:hypothetical protein